MTGPLHARSCQSQLARFQVIWAFGARFGLLVLGSTNLHGVAFDAQPMSEGGHLAEIIGFLAVIAGVLVKNFQKSLHQQAPPPPTPRLAAVTLSPRLLPIPSAASA